MIQRKAYLYGVRSLKKALKINPQKPKILSYLITNQCNSHCITCSVWKGNVEETIPSEEIMYLFQMELFSDIEHVGISGGEPSLFPELIDHIKIIVERCSHIKSLSITTNCIKPDFWEENVEEIALMCQKRNVFFQMNYSIDGVGQMHDKIRGTKGNFQNLERVIDYTIRRGIPYQLHCTVNRYNVYHINKVLGFAESKNADIIFRLASPISRLQNEHQIEKVCLNTKEISFFCDFLRSERLQSYTKSPGRRIFYLKLAEQLLGNKKRIAPCYFKQEGVVLESSGKLSYCSRFDNSFSDIKDEQSLQLFKDKELFNRCENGACTNCYHDQTGLWSLSSILGLRFSSYSTVVGKIWYVLSKLPLLILPSKSCKEVPVANISIIGMYGGGHVGDAAILGGVILRVLKRYPDVKKVTIYSIRKDRTECWVENLNRLPEDLSIEVVSDENSFRNRIKDSNVLVWAGGPVMDIPVLLTKHMSFVKTARKNGVIFEMEGIGYGPLSGKYSKWISSIIFSKASRITIRAEKDKGVMTKYSLDDTFGVYDPAFDYLRSIEGKDLLIDVEKKRAIDKIIGDNDVIALNLRPLWNRYGKDAGFNYQSFMEEIIKTVNTICSKGYKFVFFPMNSDQFGFSDLLAAYEIENLLHEGVNYEIWETEPTIEELVYFLRKVKASICMRFHAVIYSLSQSVPTIGIDYSLEGKGKVSTLLDDEHCFNMRSFNAEKVISKLI